MTANAKRRGGGRSAAARNGGGVGGGYDDDDDFSFPNGGDGSGGSYMKGSFVNADGKLDHFRDIHWIYEHLDLVGVLPSDAPSAGAYTWLMEIRRDESGDARRKFRDYYMKIAPSSKELEAREKFEDDGRNVIELIEAVERSLGIASGAGNAGSAEGGNGN